MCAPKRRGVWNVEHNRHIGPEISALTLVFRLQTKRITHTDFLFRPSRQLRGVSLNREETENGGGSKRTIDAHSLQTNPSTVWCF